MPTFSVAFFEMKRTSYSSVKNCKKKVFMTELIHAQVVSEETGKFFKRDSIISNVIDFVLSE